MESIKVYTLKEVAEIVKIKERTLYHYLKTGKLKGVKIGRRWRISEDNLKAFLNNGAPVLEANRRKASQTENKQQAT